MKPSYFFPLMCTFFAGCVSVYNIPSSVPSASLSLSVQSDGQGTTLRTSYLSVWEDESCKQSQFGERAGHNSGLGNAKNLNIKARKIATNTPFFFTANYLDARQSQNRSCAVTASFTPINDHVYKALLVVKDNVNSCNLGVYDITNGNEEQIEFFMPVHLCQDGKVSPLKNGQPLWTNYKFKVIVQ